MNRRNFIGKSCCCGVMSIIGANQLFAQEDKTTKASSKKTLHKR